MKTINRPCISWILVVACLFAMAQLAAARGSRGGGGGRGGARPSMGRVGGGGGRPSAGRPSGGNRPSHSVSSRPNVNRPSMGNVSRPTPSKRPSIASRPSGGGGFSPSGGRPNVSRPATRPGGSAIANRPSVRPPSSVGPVHRPSRPAGGIAGTNRPNLGNVGTVNRPNIGNLPTTGNRPSLGGNRPGSGGDRPSLGNINRPTTLPGNIDRPGGGNLAGGGNRPGFGGNRPGIGGERPTTLPGTIDRPGIGGNRPGGGGDRPGIGNRPGIGGNRPGGGGDRPIIGGNRPNRPGIGNGNINIGNDINIGSGNIINNRPGWNRPGWDRPDWNRPDWGWGNGSWAGNWHDHCINQHHHWYNGCWNGYWNSGWYAPLAWGAVGWGLGSLTSDWGYGTSYYNPYYVEPVVATTVPYDYSQPVVVNNYVAADTTAPAGSAPVPQQPPEDDAGLKLFDAGLAQFKSGDYQGALKNFDAALQKLPGDPVVHEVRALAQFALGEYKPAAAALNSLLSSAPGMDWTTLSSLYGNTDDYQVQLRKLEQYCKANRNDASAYFVLAYHYLAIEAKDSAIKALQVVVKNQPKDYTAKRMLDALEPPAASPNNPPQPEAIVAGSTPPETDLVGNWRAKAGDTTIDLVITEDSQFTWKAVQADKPPTEITGQVNAGSDELALETADKGSMAGSVKSIGPDQWQFALSGAPPSVPGLSFERVKN